jgi:hypothetical protein
MFTCPSDRPLQKDAVHWVSGLENTVFAATTLCEGPNGGAHDFQTGFNSNPPTWWSWYKNTGNPASDEKDAWGTASHEFGHDVGYWRGDGHFAESDDACPGINDLGNRNTMCTAALNAQGNIDKDVELGTTWKRSLESHDKHTFQNAYPA